MQRPTSDFFIGSVLRRVFAEGGYASVRRKGATQAGAIFVSLYKAGGIIDLYRPAPSPDPDDDRHASGRLFELAMEDVAEDAIATWLEKEGRYDPDFWFLEIEGVEPGSVIPLASEDEVPHRPWP